MEVNALNEGAWHTEVKAFLQSVVNNPDIILAETLMLQTATLDSRDGWGCYEETISAIQTLQPSPPHLQGALVAFFKGAAETMVWFTAEFAPGSAIDQATAEEQDLAFLPTTNDACDGLLGSYHQYR